MKKALLYFFASIGVIFTLLLLWLLWFYIADPYNLKPLFFGSSAMPMVQNEETTKDRSADAVSSAASATTTQQAGTPDTATATGGFTLSSAQQQALINLGIDPASVPNEVTYAQEQCFVGVLGEARVTEIKAGAVPSPMEFLRAKACI